MIHSITTEYRYFLKDIQNIHQNRPYAGAKSKSPKISKEYVFHLGEIKPEIKNGKITRKTPNAWKLNNAILYNLGVEEAIKMKIRKHFELNNEI